MTLGKGCAAWARPGSPPSKGAAKRLGTRSARWKRLQDAFRTIGEVAEELDLPQHVLRFWETKFGQIRPVKRAGGRRYYRPDDVQLLGAIRILLYSEGYTIKGVQRILKEQGVRAVVTASQGSLRGATVLSLSERRARGAAPEYLVEIPLDDAPAQASSGPQDDFFESAPAAPPASRELTREDNLPVAAGPSSHGGHSRRVERMRKSSEGRGPGFRTRLAALRVFPRFFGSAVASPESLVYKAGSRSVAQPG